MGFLGLRSSKKVPQAHSKLPSSHSGHEDEPTNASSGNLSTTSTLNDSPALKGSSNSSTTESVSSSQNKAHEEAIRRERQDRAWREAERRRRGAHTDSWQGGIAPPASGAGTR